MARTKKLKNILVLLSSVGALFFFSLAVFNIVQSKDSETKAKTISIEEFKTIKFSSTAQLIDIEEKDKLTIKEAGNDKSWVSPIITADFAFDALGAQWHKDALSQINIFARFSSNKKEWGEWQELEIQDADEQERSKNSSQNNSFEVADLVFYKDAKYFQHKVIFGKEKEQAFLDSIRFVYIKPPEENEIKKSFLDVFKTKKAQAVNGPRIISRTEWGANPAYMNWAPEYSTPNKVIIHHTASGNNPPDPAAVVRSIYYYHAVSLGWGDIGYNYLVDQHGNLYEGRYGGNGVVGAHAYGQNYGSIGISVIGTYTSVNITPQAFEGLTNLIAFKAYQNDFSLNWGTVFGHRDFCNNPPGHNCTACPGEVLYSRKGEIIASAATKVNQYIQQDIAFLEQNDDVVVKSYSSPAIYLWRGKLKKPFTDIKSFYALGYQSSEINYLSIHALNNYPDGDRISALLKTADNPTVYLAIDKFSGKYQIPDETTFNDFGFAWSNLQVVDPSIISSMPTLGILGKILKSPNAPAIYLIHANKKYAFSDMDAFISFGQDLSQVINFPNGFIDSFASGPHITYLIKNESSPTVYLMGNGTKYPTPNESVFSAWGFTWNNLSRLPDILVAEKTTGPSLTLFAKGSTATVYLINQGEKLPFETPEMLNHWGGSGKIINVVDSILARLTNGSAVGNIAKSPISATVYLVNGGNKYPFTNSTSFKFWGNDWPDVKTYSEIAIAGLNLNTSLKPFIKKQSDPLEPEVYLVINSEKRLVDNSTALAWGWSPERTSIIPESLFNSLATGNPVSKVVKGSGATIYLLDQGKKRPFQNLETLSAWGFSLDQVMSLDDRIINLLIPDSSIGTIIKSSNSATVYQVEGGKKTAFPSSYVFYAWGYNFTLVKTVSPIALDSLANNPTVSLLAKITESAEIFVMNGRDKKIIPSSEVLTAWQGNGSITTSSQISRLATNGSVSVIAKGSSPTIYLIEDGGKKYFPDWNTFVSWGYNLSQLTYLEDNTLLALPNNGLVSNTIKSSENPTVFYLDNGKKRKIPNIDVFFSYGFKTANIKVVDQSVIDGFPNGPILMPNTSSAAFTASGSYRIVSGGQILHQTDAGQQTRVYFYNNLYYFLAGYNLAFGWYGSTPVRIEPLATTTIVEAINYSDPNWNGSANYNRFRGTLEVVRSATGTWVVNDLPLNDYVAGVAENTPASDPSEKLKAMAVAARTYGEYHRSRGGKHLGEPFHLKNSRRGNGNDQVYCGYGYEILAGSYPALARSTDNQIILYNGGVILAAYSRGYPNRTRSALEAWGTDYPYLQSVADPYASTSLPCGTSGNHCVGLSASGAIGYANNEGRNYQWILGHYYSNTVLGTVANDKIRIAIYKF